MSTFRCVRCQQEINTGALMCPWCHADPFSGHEPSPLPQCRPSLDGSLSSFFFFFGGLLYLFSWNKTVEYISIGMLMIFVIFFIRFLNWLRPDV